MSLEDYKTDYLLLLVGGNPLPVYVSAMMLATENTHVRLLHSPKSDTSRHSEGLADLLKEVIENDAKCDVKTEPIDLINSNEIQIAIKRILEKISGGKTVGFNYTGGTKPMVLYTLRALENAFLNDRRKSGMKFKGSLISSYLNAQDKMLYIESGHNLNDTYPAKLSAPIPLETILKLHGYKLNKKLIIEAHHYAISQAIMEIHQTDDGIKSWRKWINGELQENNLPTKEAYLEPFIEALEENCGSLVPDDVSEYLNCKENQLVKCSKWFIGEWLEEYVFHIFKELSTSKKLNLHNCAWSLEAIPEKESLKSLNGNSGNDNRERRNFEFDVVAIQGYQFIGISCIASKKKDKEIKKHLLEAYVRARQLGGDEARLALVYLGDNPQVVQDEIDRSWLPINAIQVFGRKQLPNLKNYLRTWILQK